MQNRYIFVLAYAGIEVELTHTESPPDMHVPSAGLFWLQLQEIYTFWGMFQYQKYV